MILKISGVVLVVLLILFFVGYFYVSRIASGSGEGSLPEGTVSVEANGFSFATRISGNKEQTPVILLHGFPETSQMWEKLMVDLSSAGYYAIAPDQRGYSFQARPAGIENYTVFELGDDVIAIADALGIERFHLIGHDWGSGVGWQVAAKYPERLLSYTSMSVPHLDAFSRAYREDTAQFKASEYIRNFQKKMLPEFMLAKNDYKYLKSIWSKHSEEEINSYIETLDKKNALTSALNWYRANYPLIAEGEKIGNVETPTLFLWGDKDWALQRSGAEWTKEYVTSYYRFVVLEGVSHWLIQESYEDVYSEVISHLKKNDVKPDSLVN